MAERATRDSIRDIWGPRTPYLGEGRWPARVDERVIDEPERWVQSCCLLCSNGCGLDIGVKGDRIVGVRGRADDHVNRGRLGPKGLHGWIANESKDRLTHPLVRRGGKLERASWDEAMGLVVERSKRIIDEYTGKAMAFYGTGQLFIEEYHVIAMVAKAGVRTPHKDGNTRLCTATAEWALQESFGSDGQPSSYADLDLCDAWLLAGHDVSATQTVLFARGLDRLAGPDPPKLVVIDPRTTEVARHAAVHLRPRAGTNVAVLNGLIHLIIRAGQVDADFIARHTVGFDDLKSTTSSYTPERVEQITGIPAADLRRAAGVLGAARRLLATVLQGFYQPNQATAASVQVNNLVLIRGMIGKPGCGVLQMNGQPTAQNTRECGADGSSAAFYNFENPRHMEALARAYNVEPDRLPTYQPPTDVMQMMRYCETGSIKFLWIVATNPAVSLPELARIRRILSKEDLFVVVNDAFPTETTALADVVLPAALWGEKTGTVTNADRTVHISHRAIDPPGEARADFDIFRDYAARMGFKDKDGAPLIKFRTPEDSFNHWAAMTKGRLCDYSGLSYAKLSGRSGIRWPCNERHPDGAERLYADFRFPTGYDECETWGHDLKSGAAVSPETYRANDPAGRAILRHAEYVPPVEEPDDDYPLWLTTGRIVYHFHTRTKTGRSRELRDAAPDAFAQLHADDAGKLGVADGDMVLVESRRGKVVVQARVGDVGREGKAYDILPGHVFVPFHFGYWDEPGRPRAANELTLTSWDPISKQPHFKYAAVRVRKVQDDPKAAAALPPAAELAKWALGAAQAVLGSARSGKRIDHYVGLLRATERQLAEALRAVAERHPLEAEVRAACTKFAGWTDGHLEALKPFEDRYEARDDHEPERLRAAMFRGPRVGTLGLCRDVHDLWLLAQDAWIGWLALKQVSRAIEEKGLVEACDRNGLESSQVAEWCHTQFKAHIAQALLMG
jgi:anaerobic selenocysteine-containing dehydrogenase